MNNNDNTPRLRFPEFAGEWEEKKLSDCLDERNEQFPESEDYPLMAFVAGKGVSPKGEKYDRSALVKDSVNKKYKRTELGDFIYSSNNLESGSIGFNSYGSACISPVYSIFKSKNNVDSTFIGTLLTQKSFISEMVKYRQGVVYGQWKIPEKEFLGMKVFIPTPTEQQKIAECLSEMDNLINAQGQKVEALKEKKKGLMQQLFPQKGEATPRLRFPEFKGNWKEGTIGGIGRCYAGATPSTKEDSYWKGGTIPWMSSGEVHQGVVTHTAACITQEGCDHSSTRMLPVNTVVIALAGQGKTRGTVAITAIELCTNQSLCGVVIEDDKILNKFVFQYLKTCYNDLRNISSGDGSRGGLNLTMIGLYPIYIPPTLLEQQKIAECLSALDNLIDSESAKLDTLKDHKKGLMQQLFPQTIK